MSALSPQEQEALRHAALEYLVERPRFAFDASAIARALQRRAYVDFNINAENLRQTLDFLLELGHVKASVDELGSTTCFSASAKGILAEERRKTNAP